MTALGAAAAGSDRILRLAEWLADPAGWLPGGDGLDPDLRAAMAASPLLRPALNGHLSRRIGTREIALDAGFVAALMRDDDLARAAALVIAPQDALHRAAQFLGAALCQERLRAAVLRTERARLSEILGEEALGFGLRRAPLVARALQALPLAGGGDPLAAGRILCASLIHRASAPLLGLFRLRQAEAVEPVSLTQAQAEAGWAVLGAA